MSSKIASSHGKSGAAPKSVHISDGDVAEKIKQDNVRQAGVHVKSTGVPGANAGDNEDLYRSPEDLMPHAVNFGNPERDEAIRDEVSMVNNGLYGVDALGGMRPYNPELKGYLEDLRNKNTVSAYYDLMMTSFDPSDPIQRQMLDENIPGFTESKISVFESVHEQRAFIHRCSIIPKISPPERQRIVRILGGAEKFLQHPMDDIIAVVKGGSDGDASGIIAQLKRFADSISKPMAPGGKKDGSGGMPGLFSYLTVPKEDRKAYDPYNRAARSETFELRTAVATLLLKHFPRFMYGSYSPFDDGPVAKKKIKDGAFSLVLYCEKVVDTIEPIGNVAKDFLPLAAAQPKAERVYRRQVQDAFSRP